MKLTRAYLVFLVIATGAMVVNAWLDYFRNTTINERNAHDSSN